MLANTTRKGFHTGLSNHRHAYLSEIGHLFADHLQHIKKGKVIIIKAFPFVTSVTIGLSTYFIGMAIYLFELTTDFDARFHVENVLTMHRLSLFTWLTLVSVATWLAIRFLARERELRHQAETLSCTDNLTGIYNRGYFFKALDLELKRSQRYGGKFALMMIEVDDFKSYNDTFGHLAGDKALRAVARAIRMTLRETDVVARYGGDEFVVIAIETSREGMLKLANRIRLAVFQTVHVTISIGISYFADGDIPADALVEAADVAMYVAKNKGKDRVVEAAPIIHQAEYLQVS